MPDDLYVYELAVDFEAFNEDDAKQQTDAAKAVFRSIKGDRLHLFSNPGDYDDYDYAEDEKSGRVLAETDQDLQEAVDRVEALEAALQEIAERWPSGAGEVALRALGGE